MADSGRMTSYAEVMPVNPTCAWRIVISPMIPQDIPPCYYSSMRNLAVLVILSTRKTS